MPLSGLTQNHEKTNRREASALGGFPDLKQLARHGEHRGIRGKGEFLRKSYLFMHYIPILAPERFCLYYSPDRKDELWI
jgi:hypothetical protein